MTAAHCKDWCLWENSVGWSETGLAEEVVACSKGVVSEVYSVLETTLFPEVFHDDAKPQLGMTLLEKYRLVR